MFKFKQRPKYPRTPALYNLTNLPLRGQGCSACSGRGSLPVHPKGARTCPHCGGQGFTLSQGPQ